MPDTAKDRYPHSYDGKWPDFQSDIKVSYIVSTYNRPWFLRTCLASLRCQSDQRFEIIVVDNTTDGGQIVTNGIYCTMFGAKHLVTQAKSCYHSSAIGAEQAKGEYLCFPSDDSYYVPMFQEYMVKLADEKNLGFVYCGILYNGFYDSDNPELYAVYNSKAKLHQIDKTQYLIRRELFDGFAAKNVDCPSADGHIIAELVRKGTPHAKHEGVLVVHN